jgi:pectate lyase
MPQNDNSLGKDVLHLDWKSSNKCRIQPLSGVRIVGTRRDKKIIGNGLKWTRSQGENIIEL